MSLRFRRVANVVLTLCKGAFLVLYNIKKKQLTSVIYLELEDNRFEIKVITSKSPLWISLESLEVRL